MRENLFRTEQLAKILEQAMIHMCACPAQICKQLSAVKGLYEYQAQCINRNDTDRAVHQRIALAASKAHEELENCLRDVLMLEGWDMETLEMPSNLHKKMFDE